MYCVFHFEDKSVFAHMGEFGLMPDQKDFATNGYKVDKEHHPRTTSKASGRKEKAMALALEEDKEQEEEQEIFIAGGASYGTDDDPLIHLSDNDDDGHAGGSDATLSATDITSFRYGGACLQEECDYSQVFLH